MLQALISLQHGGGALIGEVPLKQVATSPSDFTLLHIVSVDNHGSIIRSRNGDFSVRPTKKAGRIEHKTCHVGSVWTLVLNIIDCSNAFEA